MHIGNAVAFGIDASNARRVRQVKAETIGGAQPRPLSNHRYDLRCTQELADLIAQCDSRLFSDDHRADAPIVQQLQRSKQRRYGVQ
jgi:hypothetical protein